MIAYININIINIDDILLVCIMCYRILARNLTFVRFPETIARYTMIKHNLDPGNPKNRKR